MAKIIKITNKQLAASDSGIGAVLRLTVKDGLQAGDIQKIARWGRIIVQELENYQKGKNELVREHSKEDAEGVPLDPFVPKNVAEWNKVTDIYMAETVELNVPRLKIEMLGKKMPLSGGELMVIDWWVEYPENETKEETDVEES